MLLAIDIGNTTVSLAVMRGKRVAYLSAVENSALPAALNRELVRLQKKCPRIDSAVICSVVPKVLRTVERAVRKHSRITPKVVGRDIKVPIRNNYRRPRQVGQDRLVCAYATQCLYGSPAIVIDLGTAITLDVISAKGSYEGGIIVPGIRLSAESLFQKTALLPKIHAIKGPHALIGKSTQESILSGLFYGYGSLCHGLIERISTRIKDKPKVIVTGGHTQLMRRYFSEKITAVDRHLVFRGMYFLTYPPALRKKFS